MTLAWLAASQHSLVLKTRLKYQVTLSLTHQDTCTVGYRCAALGVTIWSRLIPGWLTVTPFRSLLKCHLLRNAIPESPLRTSSPAPLSADPVPHLFSLITLTLTCRRPLVCLRSGERNRSPPFWEPGRDRESRQPAPLSDRRSLRPGAWPYACLREPPVQ